MLEYHIATYCYHLCHRFWLRIYKWFGKLTWIPKSDFLLKWGPVCTSEGVTVRVGEAVPVSLQCFGCAVLGFCLWYFYSCSSWPVQKHQWKTSTERSPQKAAVTVGWGDFYGRLLVQWRQYPGRGPPFEIHPTHSLRGRSHWRASVPDADWWARAPEEEKMEVEESSNSMCTKVPRANCKERNPPHTLVTCRPLNSKRLPVNITLGQEKRLRSMEEALHGKISLLKKWYMWR